VRAVVVTAEPERRRLAVSLKPSVTGNGEVDFMACLLRDLELASKLHQEAEAAVTAAGGGRGDDAEEEAVAEPVDWSATFRPGSLALGAVHQVQPHGLLLDLDDHPDVVGHVAEGQGVLGGKSKEGVTFTPEQRIAARVLDVDKVMGIVELSLQEDLVKGLRARGGKSTPKLKLGQEVAALVVAPKEHYTVVVLPEAWGVLGVVSRGDFNQQGLGAGTSRSWGEGVKLHCKVAALPEEGNGWRLLLRVIPAAASRAVAAAGAAGGAAATGAAGGGGGGVVTATVTRVDELGLEVDFGKVSWGSYPWAGGLRE
jgi:hypothetical protein